MNKSNSNFGMSRAESGRLGGLASLETRQKKTQLLKQQYDLNPKACTQCGSNLTFEQRHNTFCSKSCAAKHNNPMKIKILTNFCLHCGKPIKSKYCSLKCQADYRWANRKQEVLTSNKPVNTRTIKKLLLEELGHQCQQCLNTEWNGQPIHLELEHINGDSGDNNRENITLLCPNCHAQTPTYKAKNRGNGRHARRERYKSGKSY